MSEANEQANNEVKEGIPENVVYIGKKPAMSYVLAVVTQFNNGAKNVKIKARGNTISRAVDVAEISRNRFLQGTRVENITINSEELQNEDGTKSKVSTIEITLVK
ncbi:MAG: DNA-binding protein Alba [Candidatus Micrarchaeaceae archaeon]